MARPQKIDWVKVEADYVSSDLSQSELAEKYKVSERHLARKASVGGWTGKRQQYRTNLTQKLIEKKYEHDSLDKQRFDEHTNAACDVAVAEIALLMVKGDIPPSKMKDYLAAVETLQRIKYRTLDIPAPMQRHDITENRKAPADITMESIVEDLRQFINPDELTFIIPADKVKGNCGGNGGQA